MPNATAGDGACYKRRNDDSASSFRRRDKACVRVAALDVKFAFNGLIRLWE